MHAAGTDAAVSHHLNRPSANQAHDDFINAARKGELKFKFLNLNVLILGMLYTCIAEQIDFVLRKCCKCAQKTNKHLTSFSRLVFPRTY